MRTYRDWLFKIILPLALLGLLIYGMLTHTGFMNAEIPIDNQPDPWPLDQKACPEPQPGSQPPKGH